MHIVVCATAVQDIENINVAADGTLDTSKANWTVSSYDLNAIEAGKQLADATGGTLSGLMLGGAELKAAKLKKEIGSRGLSDLYVVADDAAAGADSLATAKALAAAIEKIPDVDLVLCGTGSDDGYNQQVGNMLGELLGRPVVNEVDNIEVDGAGLKVQRAVDGGVQVLSLPTPAVVSVTSSINTPRIPGMKDILAAGKIPLNESEIAGDFAGQSTATQSILAQEHKARAGKVIEGDDDAAIAELAAFIKAQG